MASPGYGSNSTPPYTTRLPANTKSVTYIYICSTNNNTSSTSGRAAPTTNYTAGALYEVPADLSPGTYRFVAWTNQGEAYKTNKATSLSDIQLYLEDSGQSLFTKDIPDLHYGTHDKIIVDPMQDKEYTIHLIPNTYRVNLTVNELPVGSIDDSYLLVIADNNTRYNFNNRVIENQKRYSHERTSGFKDGKLTASIRTLTLHNDHAIENIGKEDTGDRSPTILFKNTTQGTDLFTGDMVKIIRTAYRNAGEQVDFDKTYLFDIILTFDAEMNVTVSVNGWVYTPNGTEL